ncbi:MAG: hypothetical protein UV63_C0001G0079 [Microgenomates group bacterium GW2011_GWC1_43_11]|uniref:Uncharacterized protein n=2 Tax=Candidatus Gottesmaniibacteriota TaxID=1752720 RepID=A0A0G1IQL8_9BACT|nr:MAG: hypothetical protein UV63_C0001G0079 [Microgenomates group bacterium GW2011_GWC1_43_11]KKT39168.1 MAG: hypothetical protein UW22_C0001G0079 [Candidatus Gottesmanbacteria bacterium GW2011_GWB1_44_11c]KKT61641.1 MAG: hypothetical protein UW52_C0001G0079 [Candidatus Gottesmanbacteria bacterium GW2011_GWA1_44_24b]HCM82162.1 hypothetical protein [Patescibacteria group bacterium]
MKILLITTPKEKEIAITVLDDYNSKARSNFPPLGLLYLHSYLKSKHNVSIVDMNAKEMKISDITSIVKKHKPDLVGISCVINRWLAVIDLAKLIKKVNRNIHVVVGGPNPSIYPYETLQCPDIDYVISGFGQVPLMELCDQLEKGQYRNNIENCYTRDICNSQTKGSFRYIEIDKFPLPDRTAVPIKLFHAPFCPENPFTTMISSVGCPGQCAFCPCKNYKPIIMRKPEYVADEMESIYKLGIRSVMFQDELFTISAQRVQDICKLLLKRKIKLHWTIKSRVNYITKDYLEFGYLDLMKKAGCFNISLGIESGTDRILEKMKKYITTKQVIETVRMIKKSGLSCTASFMLGYMDETREEIHRTIDFAVSLGLDNCQFFITMPEPQTELYDELQIIRNTTGNIYSKFTLEHDGMLLKNNIASERFSREEMIEFMKEAYRRTKNLYIMDKLKHENKI